MRSDVFNVCCLVRVPGICSQPSPEARLSASITAGPGGWGVVMVVGAAEGGSYPLGPVLQEYERSTPRLPLGCSICAPFFVATAGGATFNL